MFRRLLLGLLATALLAPAAAGAHPKVNFIPPFRVTGTNGYTVEAYAVSKDRNGEPAVVISIWDRSSETTYTAPGKIEWNGYSASFGRLGWIDMHYVRSPSRTVKDCRGRARQEDDGRFTGTIEFHGEERFTEVDYPWLEARPVSQYESICWGAEEGGKGARLDGLSRWGETTAFANGERGRVRFGAEAANSIGKTTIYRYLQVFGPTKDFVWSRRLTSARITPPAPFHGSASFHLKREKGNVELGRFRGHLTVDFPGFRGYPLTTAPTLGVIKAGGCRVRGAAHRSGPPIPCL
jgi:hypothetical protein